MEEGKQGIPLSGLHSFHSKPSSAFPITVESLSAFKQYYEHCLLWSDDLNGIRDLFICMPISK